MRHERIDISSGTPGHAVGLHVRRYGAAGARPRAYLQAALHADETPGMLVLHHLGRSLEAAEARGALRGEVVLVPAANPLGLGQRVLGRHIGRFDLADGVNFNRDFPNLIDGAASRLDGRLGGDAAANVAAIRAALAAELAARPAVSAAEHLKKALASLAVEADIVLDLHCDAEATMHLYTLDTLAERAAPPARLLGARALLVAAESGGDPFDEAASLPWPALAARFPAAAIPHACFAATVELRGRADVSHEHAAADAAALEAFLILEGVVAGPKPALPAALCAPTPLAASEPVKAPVAGIVVFRAALGERLAAGAVVAELVDPVTGAVTPVAAQSAGLVYTRTTARFAEPGKLLAKIAGTTLARSGKLLSP
jgi:hypothetical protein